MEYNFADACRRISQDFSDLANAYEENFQVIKARLDSHEIKIVNDIETKRKILAALQENLNGI